MTFIETAVSYGIPPQPVPDVGRQVIFESPMGMWTGRVISVQDSEPCSDSCPCGKPGMVGKVTIVLDADGLVHFFGSSAATWRYVDG